MTNSTKISGLFLEISSDEDNYGFIDLSSNPTKPPFESLGLTITQSCNGLLLCCDNNKRINYSVINPATNHRTVIPPPPPPTGGTTPAAGLYSVESMSLAFDPSKSAHYKAVCVRNFTGDESQHQIDIYSSETGSWRPSSLGFFEAEFNPMFERGVFWNGCIHWIHEWDQDFFRRFDVDAERVYTMPMPPLPEFYDLEDCYRGVCYFAAAGDRLHFVDRFVPSGESHLKVYEMGRDYSGWSVKYVLDVSEVSRAFPETIWSYDSEPEIQNYYLSVLCIVPLETEEESYVVINIPGKVLRYSLKDGTFSKLCDVPIVQREMVFDPSQVFPYIESVDCV